MRHTNVSVTTNTYVQADSAETQSNRFRKRSGSTRVCPKSIQSRERAQHGNPDNAQAQFMHHEKPASYAGYSWYTNRSVHSKNLIKFSQAGVQSVHISSQTARRLRLCFNQDARHATDLAEQRNGGSYPSCRETRLRNRSAGIRPDTRSLRWSKRAVKIWRRFKH